MSEDRPSNDTGATHDLRTITARLTDLQRKCRSAGSRNQDAEGIEERLTSVLNQLKSDNDEDDTSPIPFGALARELYAVEHFFQSNGFITVAKEVAHVERALESLATDNEPEPEAPIDLGLPSSEPGDAELDHGSEESDDEPQVSRWAMPKPLAVVLVLFVLAVIACAAVIYRLNYVDEATEVLTGPALPTPSFETPRTRTAIPANPAPNPRGAKPAPGAVLAREIGLARLALADGDIDAVIDHLSRASLVDPDHATVLGTANQLVDLLMDRADSAADGGLWEIADLTLARADRIATRYGLDHHRIQTAARRYSKMERFRLVHPSDPEAIRAATGSRITIIFRDGSTRDSIIKGADAGHLLLDEDAEVRGGAMYYTERIPLSAIDYLKVWE